MKQLRVRLRKLREDHDRIYHLTRSEGLPSVNWGRIIEEKQVRGTHTHIHTHTYTHTHTHIHTHTHNFMYDLGQSAPKELLRMGTRMYEKVK